MKIRMKFGISGGRADGTAWPMAGGILDAGPREAAELCAAGIAVPVTDDEDEPETRPDKAAAEKRGDSAPAFDTIDASGGAVAAAAQDAARATGGKSAVAATLPPRPPVPPARPGPAAARK